MGGDNCEVLAAGVPNIIGTVGWTTNGIGLISGAFYEGNTSARDRSYYENDNSGIGFDASRCSSVYGNSDTVMPASFSLIPQIRY